MYRGTTPTLYLELETDLALDNLSELWVTFKIRNGEVTKNLSQVVVDPTTKIITVSLSQQDTLALCSGNCNVQVRFRLANGEAYATTIEDINVERILKDGVI